LLALAGDVGCSAGPAVVGLVSGMFADNLKAGILAAAVFPVLLLISLLIYHNSSSQK
jgi:MFS-type transporter involved in bile tolerance (Atg22 family)